eukprot:COSAG06_NODE_4873_length_3889_cov_10.023320_1_plen_29_part_10
MQRMRAQRGIQKEGLTSGKGSGEERESER